MASRITEVRRFGRTNDTGSIARFPKSGIRNPVLAGGERHSIRTGISLRLSVSETCQLRCRYCRPERDDTQEPARKPLEREELLTLLRCLHLLPGIAKLRFTGGEPLLRCDLPEIVASCARLSIGDLALTTNGQRLEDLSGELKRAGLHRVNVSLDSLDSDVYATVTRGGVLALCLAGIEAALVNDLRPVKLNMVVMRNLNDQEVSRMLDFALETGCHIRYLELMPIGVAADEFRERFVGWREVYDRIAARGEFTPLPYELGSTSRNYQVRDTYGRTTICGFISPSSYPFCHGCNRLRLTSDGRLFGCLAHRGYVDLRQALEVSLQGDERCLAAAIHEALAIKRLPHDLSKQREMAHIGG